MTIYGELRHADGTRFGGYAREPLDVAGRTPQAAVDDLAGEVRGQGGLGEVDLPGVPGRVAVFAVAADGSVLDAASAPWHPRRGV